MFGKVRQLPTEEQIRAALQQVKFPGFSRDIVSFGLVESITVADKRRRDGRDARGHPGPGSPAENRAGRECRPQQLAGIGRIRCK